MLQPSIWTPLSDTLKKVCTLLFGFNRMFAKESLIPGKKLLRKLSIKKPRWFYNSNLIYKRSIPSAFKAISKQKKRIRTLEKMSLLIRYLLIDLMESNNPLSTRLIKKTKITKKVFGAIVDKDKVVAKTSLSQMSILLSKKKKRTSPKLSAFFRKKEPLHKQMS